MRQEKVLQEASFDAKLVTYWMASVQIMLLFIVVTIPLMPIWLVFGWGFHRKQLERLSATLTERSLNIKRGLIFRVEKNVPLDKIQDLTMKEGPLLRWLGLALLHVETAGQNVGGTGGAHLVGVVDAPKFRDAVLEQRDLLVSKGLETAAPNQLTASSSADDERAMLEIRDSLLRIEQLLKDRSRS